MAVWMWALGSVLLVSLVSFVGIAVLSKKSEHLKKLLLFFISFSAGAMLGDAFIHLLPEIVEEHGFSLQVSVYLLLGIGLSFIVEKIIHWRHCHIPPTKRHVHRFAWMNLWGDAVHNFIDGIIIASSYLISLPVGIATTLAVILHEIPQEIGDFGVLLHGGFSKAKALFLNFLTALTAVLGTVAALLIGGLAQDATLFLVPFAAGSFVYIAGSDLIPELHHEEKLGKSLMQFVIFALGVAVMALLLLLG